MTEQDFGQAIKEYYESIGISLVDDSGNYKHILDIMQEHADYVKKLQDNETRTIIQCPVCNKKVVVKKLENSKYNKITNLR